MKFIKTCNETNLNFIDDKEFFVGIIDCYKHDNLGYYFSHSAKQNNKHIYLSESDLNGYLFDTKLKLRIETEEIKEVVFRLKKPKCKNIYLHIFSDEYYEKEVLFGNEEIYL